MITRDEILKGKLLPSELEGNFNLTYKRANDFRDAYGRPMIVTSGWRSIEDHSRIYAERGIYAPPMGSNHLKCLAIDISERDGNLKNFICNNTDLLEEIGIWVEDFYYTPTWVHLQFVPPGSGKRFFIP